MIECSVCHSKLVVPTSKTVSRAYDRYRSKVSSKQRALNVLLVVGDCMLVGLQPILVFMSKVDGNFKFSPISVNFLTEIAKVLFAIVMLLIQARHQKVGEKPLLSISTFVQTCFKMPNASSPSKVKDRHSSKYSVAFAYNYDPYRFNVISSQRCLGTFRHTKDLLARPNMDVDCSSKLGYDIFVFDDMMFSFGIFSASIVLCAGLEFDRYFGNFIPAARSNVLLAVPAFLYAINNYLKFIMQFVRLSGTGYAYAYSTNELNRAFVQASLNNLYFNPATVKMLSNLKVLVIAVLLKIIMKRRFSIIQWEALALLLIGISINQLRSLPEGTTALGLPVATGAYVYTMIFVTVPSLASVYNEYALKSQYETSIYLQNLFLYGYGAIFNFLAILVTSIFKGPDSFDILQGHSKATMLLILNNAGQGILSSFFFKYADTILKKYSSTVATIFTGIASAALFGHTLTINFILGISVVFISMHQFFSPLSKVKDEQENGVVERVEVQDNHRLKESSFINMAAGANEEASHHAGPDERKPLLPT
ncbi:hypothetical protein LguiA_003039 [Lonicera macranthoides]